MNIFREKMSKVKENTYVSFFQLLDINTIFRISYLVWELISNMCNTFNMCPALMFFYFNIIFFASDNSDPRGSKSCDSEITV